MDRPTIPEPVPGREHEFMADLFAVFVAVTRAGDAERERLRVERRNTPEAKVRRSEGARAGWATRRAREQAEAAQEAAMADPRDVLTGPFCEFIDFTPFGEASCWLAPGHGGDHDDTVGHTWPADDDE